MKNEKELLHTFKRMAALSNRSDLDHQKKLQCLLREMTNALNAEKGSVMILSGRNRLEIRASTNSDLIGVRQPLSETSPSAWVVKNRKLLYVDRDHPFEWSKSQARDYKKDAFLLAPVIRGRKVAGIISITDKRGEDQFDLEEQSLLLDFAGLIIGDIENHRLTESLRKKKKELQKKNLELKRLERLRKDLFNMLIHDLKGPLSDIVANTDILSYTVEGENKEYVAATQAGCDTLFRMTSDLLDIARLEEESLGLIHERMRSDELILEAIARVHAIAKTRSISLNTVLPEDKEPPVVSVDRGMLLRVLQNLLTNAIHHSTEGKAVDISFDSSEKRSVRFLVRDQGPGIPLEYQKAIFNKFFQVSKKRDGRIYSTGLGLTFCKMAVEAHGGTITVESDGKSGSCFIFTLPTI